MKIDKVNYKNIYKKAANQGGWSDRKPDNTTKWGDFYDAVRKELHGTEVLLDIGTAEGNRFMGLSKYIKKGVGIDLEPDMIKLAKRNKQKAGVKNIIFKCMDADCLDLPAGIFDVITIKHSPINFKESFRVLKSGGRLFTQQVCEDDKLNLKKAFNRGQDFDKKAGTLLERYKRQAEQTGFKNIKAKVSNIPDYFKSKKNLLDFLNKAPTIPEFGKTNDYEILERFIKNNRVEKGIKSNTSRFFLEMSKK